MKTIYSLFLSILSIYMVSLNAKAQCTADAGSDTSLCVTLSMPTFNLGGSPTAIGGIPPYTYNWTCIYRIFTRIYAASDFLDDTTISNPQLINGSHDTLTFYLTVTDRIGNTCSDVFEVEFCGDYVYTMDYKYVHIHKGDTAQIFPSVGGGCPPLNFEWTPKYNISDPYVYNPYVWSDTTTIYNSTVTDSGGCIAGGGSFDVIITAVGLKENNIDDNIITISPNPVSNLSVFNIISERKTKWTLEIYNVLGVQVKKISTYKNDIILDGDDFGIGVYFYNLSSKNGIINQGKIMFIK